jgi:glycosyltransferase involved in cell wall biosynthesis
MRVLLVATDLYREIGGGQTVYRSLIRSAPHIEFFYFRENEAADAPRPHNATTIPLRVRLKLKVLAAPPYPAYRRSQLQDADRYARSVAGEHFDIVDIPDYYSFGSLLPDAFAHHGVTVKRIVLAMHGNISTSLEMGWGSAGDNVLEQRMLERDQFEMADGAYAISPRYIREWQSITDRPVHYIDPICFADVPDQTPMLARETGAKPALYCIGRTERRKGNDLFVELVRWLDPAAYARAAHIGDEVVASWGVGTRHILWDIARKRDMTVEHLPSCSRQELSKLFRARSVVILPVRYDSLNLIALEALFEGCPVAVSSKAGVCDYLDEVHPGLPYIKIDFDDFYSAAERVGELLANYDDHRNRLLAYLSTALPKLSKVAAIDAVYSAILGNPSTAARPSVKPIPYVESGRTLVARTGRVAKRLLATNTYQTLRRLVEAPREFLLRKLRESEYFGDARFLSVLADARYVPGRLKRIAEHSEYNRTRLREKLDEIYAACSNPLYRCNFWLDIARIERILGNDLTAVAYELRALRLVGWDAFGILSRVVRTLRKNGFALEADAVGAIYAGPNNGGESVYAFLQGRYLENLRTRELAYELVDDRRSGTPKVAVIVSLYKAASKLRVFLTTMARQTLGKRGGVEFIFVDSGSPDCELDVLRRFWSRTPMNAVYARSARRETIQGAWNRGIQLARAPYLVFLGVDETLYPEALQLLAAELDGDESIEWVMGNSLVTAVDEHGIYKNDVMPYDRNGGTKDHAYLETCYLSWVGGMYRKSIHERFGYYDETFSAAGDTEFKNRVLPHIRVKFVPRTLGLFLNYPDERTTASPRAEIEDSRAWYIHRTPGGVRYAFENRSTEDVERLLCAALGYRKSYCRHISSDVEYAAHVAAYLSARSGTARSLCDSLRALLATFRAIEFAHTPPSRFDCLTTLVAAWRSAASCEAQHRSAIGNRGDPTYKVLNDNRYEQHSWLWRSG